MTKPIAAILVLSCLTTACGEATDADAAPSPDELVSVAEVERTMPEPEEEAPEVGEIDSVCRANLAQPFVGQALDLETRSELLDAVEPQAIIRFLDAGEEDDGTSMPDRLNVRTDESDAITEVFCG